jgi:hypothetical protein
MNLFDKMDHAPTLKQKLQGETNLEFMPYHVRVPGRQSFRHTSYMSTAEHVKANKAKAKRKSEKKARKQSRSRK